METDNKMQEFRDSIDRLERSDSPSWATHWSAIWELFELCEIQHKQIVALEEKVLRLL